MRFFLALSLCLGSIPGLLLAQSSASSSPLVDGFADEYEALGAQTWNLKDGVKLFVYQDDHHVWMAYTLSEGSYGTLDMTLETPGLGEPYNLHVSAQLGEWPLSKPELAPDNARSDRWWNHRGWVANPLWFNGLETSRNEPQAHFKLSKAREIQLSKARFGKGVWRFRLKINALRDAAGKFTTVQFPDAEGFHELKVN